MMPDLGTYAVPVVSAYVASLALIAGLCVATWMASRRARAVLADAEARAKTK